MEPVIRLENVCKRFRDCRALDHVTLRVPPGVVFAILGENGAGKTTLIRILTGFLKPDEGSARVLGMDLLADPLAIRRAVGYVSDAPAMYEWMTPMEIGWFTSGFYDDAFPGRYLESLAKYDVPSGTKLKHLSKGQRAKVALALATAHDPSLLILDEPTSGLDPMVRRQFLESMVDRAALGHTVLLSSHQISEVERVADWVAILHEGRRRVVQPLSELKANTAILTAKLEDPWSEIPTPTGEVLAETRRGRQIRWLVRGPEESWLEGLGSDSGLTDLQVSRPSLEEIFVSLCDRRVSRPTAESHEDARDRVEA